PLRGAAAVGVGAASEARASTIGDPVDSCSPMAKPARGGPFPTTRWSVVLTAADEGETPRRALHELLEAYWAPLFAYLRRTGMSVADAEDTVQGFVSSLLDGAAIAGVDRERGRFRSYLLGALRNYLGRQQA